MENKHTLFLNLQLIFLLTLALKTDNLHNKIIGNIKRWVDNLIGTDPSSSKPEFLYRQEMKDTQFVSNT